MVKAKVSRDQWLVIRSKRQSSVLKTHLANQGIQLLTIPLVCSELVAVNNEKVSTFNTFVFTSVNGVRAAKPYKSILSASDHSVFALGKSATLLRRWLGKTVTTSSAESARELAVAIATQLKDKISTARILHLTSEQARDTLCHVLRERGYHAESCSIYRTVRKEISNDDQEKLTRFLVNSQNGSFRGGIMVFSPSQMRALLEVAAQLELPFDIRKIQIISIGPTTAEALKQAGFSKVQVAPEVSLKAIAHSVACL